MKRYSSGSISKKFCIFISLLLLSSCKNPVVELSRTSFVLGNNNIVRASKEKLSLVPIDVINSMVLIATWRDSGEVKFCSGVHFPPSDESSPGRIISNHHCFADETADGKTQKELIKEACHGTKIFFGFSEANSHPIEVRKCVLDTFRTDYFSDLAVFAYDSPVPDYYPKRELWLDEELPTDREALVVHYPNISEHLVKLEGESVNLPTASLTVDDCLVKGRFPSSEWEFDTALAFSFRHSCDLIKGSSGSALIDRKTHKIIGINWGGVKISYYKSISEFNSATSSFYVDAWLKGETKKYIAELFRIQGSSSALLLSGNSVPSDGKEPSSGKKTVPKGCSVGAYFDKSFHWIYLFIVLLLPPGIFLPRWLSHPRKNQLGRML